VAAPVRWNISFPAPRPFHPSACKRRQGITDQFSIGPSSTAAAASLQSSAAFSSQRSSENHPPPKPLPRQIPIDGQALTAFPRVRSSEAFRRRPAILGQSIAPRRHPKPFTITLHDSGPSRSRTGTGKFDPFPDIPPSVLKIETRATPEFSRMGAYAFSLNACRPLQSRLCRSQWGGVRRLGELGGSCRPPEIPGSPGHSDSQGVTSFDAPRQCGWLNWDGST
jgi:hypothetical protein